MDHDAIDGALPPLEARNRPGLYRYLAFSDAFIPRSLRGVRRWILTISMPAPRVLTLPVLRVFLVCRSSYHYLLRVFVCEPLFKAYCTQYGQRVHTGCFLHWIQGKGRIILGDDVTLDGKISIAFAARFSDQPILQIGDKTGIGHGCAFIIGKRITIGRQCTLSGNIRVFDSNGHPVDPEERVAGRPPADDDVRPVSIGDNVWIGQSCLIFPGVRIGDGSVISAGSVVRSHVPPFTVVAGNPAKVMFRLKKPSAVAKVA